jgi:hypothetical protein
MSKHFNRIMSFIIILSQISLLLPAEELRPDLRRGMARLEHYLDRASLERNAEKWESLAQAGLLAAMVEWESGNLYLREQDSPGWEKDRALAAAFYEKEAESARARWLAARVYEERAGFESGGLIQELRKAAETFTWNNGSGDSRIVNFADGEKARAAWEFVAEEIVGRYMSRWEAGSGAAYLELENRFRGLGLEEAVKEKLLKEAGEQGRAEALREYRRIAGAEENSLMMELLYDHESLKNISGEKAAGLIARELAREAEEAANTSVRALFQKLDTLIAEEDPGDITVSSHDWLNQFRRIFEEGLAKWEAAELGFLAARAEWEREAEQIYIDGEGAWTTAYRELEERQLSWENELLQKLDDAYIKWQESGRALEEEIAEAREKFFAAAEESREIRIKMVKIQGDIYARSRDMMNMAQTAIADWYERWGYIYENVYIRWQSINDKGEIPDLIHNYLTDLLKTGDIDYITGFQGERIPEILKQYELWQQACQKIIEYSDNETINQEILTSGESLFGEAGGWVLMAGYYRERADGTVQELYRVAGLDMEGAEADGYLSELEREYLKALAVEEYWADERAVAAALDEYSIRNDSGLEALSQTLEELEKARNSYAQTAASYRNALNYLDILSAEIDEVRRSFEETQAELERLGEIVESTRKELSVLNAVMMGLQPDTVKIQISEIIARMVKIYDGIVMPEEWGEEALSINGAADSYIDALHAWAEAQRMAEIFRILEDLETPGSGEIAPEEKRRRELIRAYLLEDNSAGPLSGADIEMLELIAGQYKTFRISEVNAADREARERVSALIVARDGQKADPGNLSETMLFVRKLRKAGEGLNTAGQEALKIYISRIIEYAALRRVHSLGEKSRPDVSAMEASYNASLLDYENAANYQYSLYDTELYLKMLGSSDFAAFSPAKQDIFIGYAGELVARSLGITITDITGEGALDEKALNGMILKMGDQTWTKALLDLEARTREKIYRSVLSQKAGESFFADVKDSLEAFVLEKWQIMTDAAFSLEYANFVIRELDLGRFERMEQLGGFQLEKAQPENKLSKEQRENIERALAQSPEDLYRRMEEYISHIGSCFSNEKDWSYKAYNPRLEQSVLSANRDAAMRKLKYASEDYALSLNAEIAACEELEDPLNLLEKIIRNQGELGIDEKALNDKLNAVKTDFEKYSTGEYAEAIDRIQKSYEKYNQAITAAEESYRRMKDARLKLRERQEIYDWASSVYLNGFGRNGDSEFPLPKEKLSEADYTWQRARVSVEVLEGLLNRNHETSTQYNDSLAAYREAGEKYYTALVAAYETEAAITRQKEVTRKAEFSLEESCDIFVREDQSASLAASDVVTLERNADGTYRIILGYGMGENKEEIYKTYFGERTEIVETVDGYKEYTRADIEAREWIEKIFKDPQGLAYFDDIMLAALYLNTRREDAEAAEWFKDAGNPRDSRAYAILDGPNGVYHEVDVDEVYRDSRMDVMNGAYKRVLDRGEEGREDLARYLLYRERNLVIGGAAAEKDLLEAKSLGRPADALDSKADEKNIIAWAAQGTAIACFAAAAAALFGAGALIRAGLAAEAIAVANFILEDDYRWACDRIKSFRNANAKLSEEYDQYVSGNFQILLERKAELDRQQRRLYLMLFGEETMPANKAENRMNYNQFVTAINTLFPDPGLVLPVEEKQVISREEALALYHSSLYRESGASGGKDIMSSIGILNTWLKREEDKSQEKLAAEEARLAEIQRKAAEDYRAFLEAEQEMPEELKDQLRNYARLAADQSLSVAERNSASAAYEALLAKIRPASETLRRTIKTMAEKAWGAGTLNSKSISLDLAEFRGDIFNTLVFYSRDNEAYSQKAFEDLEKAAIAVIDKGALSPLEVKEHEWELLRKDWTKQYNRWTEQSAEILRLSKNEWEKARERLNEGYYVWRNKFSGEYNAKNAEWELNYLGFVEVKRNWVEEQYLRAEEAGNSEILERLGMETEEAVRETLAELTILRMNREEPDLDGYLETLLADTRLSELMSHTGDLEHRAGTALTLAAPGPRRSQEAAALAAAEKTLREISEDIRKAAVNLAASQSLKRLEELRRQILSSIEERNSDIWEWERKMVTEGGYSTDGIISREMVTDTSLLSTKVERQTVHRYRYYSAPDFYTHVDLSPLAVAALDPETVILMVAQAEQDIKEWGAELLSTKTRDGREGKMEAHIGYAPKFKDEPDLKKSAVENLRERGSGEIGLIMLDYQWNSMLAQRGVAEIAKPVYDRKLWINTSDSIVLEPPTVRSVADMGMQIAAGLAMAAAIPTGTGMALYAGINMIDDLIFAAADLSGGYKSPEEVGKELGKKSLVTAVGAVSGAAMSSMNITQNLSTYISKTFGEGFGGKLVNFTAASAVDGLKGFTSGTINSAVSAAYWDEDGDLAWSWDTFREGLDASLVNAASGMTGTLTSGLLGQINLGEDGVLAGGFNPLQKIDMARMNGFLGDMAANAVTYQMTGSASFNLLRYSEEFGSRVYSTGLLELQIGSQGLTARLGTGGMDVSPGTLSSAFKGMVNWGISGGSEIAARRDGVKNAVSALRSLWGYGDGEASALLMSTLFGDTRLARGDEKAAANAETLAAENGKKILLNRYQDDMSLGEQLLMGVTLQHEAYRNGTAGSGNYLETRDAVLGHTEMAIRMLLSGENLAFNNNLLKDIAAYVNGGGDSGSFNTYVDRNYDSSGDYWLLKTDGTIADDGSADLHWEGVVKNDKEGREYYKTIWYAGEGMSKEESLVALLGGREEALKLLQANSLLGMAGASEQSIGELILKNYLGENSVLALDYSRFDMKGVTGKDWQAIYDSYAQNKIFYETYTLRGQYRGDKALLKRENVGDEVTTDLEYYSLLYYPMLNRLKEMGITNVSDPLAYLVENTSSFSYSGWGSVRVHNSMKDGLKKAFDAAIEADAKIPVTNGGLLMRFQDSSHNNNLVLSEHALGMAVDFDAKNNGMYFITEYVRNNPEFAGYLKSQKISLAEIITGYDANKKLAQAFSGYEKYLEDSLNSSINAVKSLPRNTGLAEIARLYTNRSIGIGPVYGSQNTTDLETLRKQTAGTGSLLRARANSLIGEINIKKSLLKDAGSIPKLSFSMEKAFVENMRIYFDWGGDWKYSKDYMHFEAKRK